MIKHHLILILICLIIWAGFSLCACGQQSYLQRHAETVTGAAETETTEFSETEYAATEELTGDNPASGDSDGQMPSDTDLSESADAGEKPDGTSEKPQICVQITGAVKNPGVYFLEENARLYALVEAAGGLTKDADADAINQARVIADGEQIIVRTREQTAMEAAYGGFGAGNAANGSSDGTSDTEIASGSDLAGSDGRIDLNTADQSALANLPGIGETKAAAIIAYRSAHGRFSAAEEIMQVPGIKSGTYEKIKDRIAVR